MDQPERPDLYVLLGVTQSASESEIKSAYRERVRIYHPDRFDRTKEPANWSAANKLLIELNFAYHVLSDPSRRAAYDTSFHRPPQPKASSDSRPSEARGILHRIDPFWPALVLMIPLVAVVVMVMRNEKRDDEYFLNGPPQQYNATTDPTAVSPQPPSEGTVDSVVGCEPDAEQAALPENGTTWRIDQRPGLAPLQIRTSSDQQFLVKLADGNIPVLFLLVRAGETAEINVPLGNLSLKYAAGTGENWCGYNARFPFGRETSFHKANEVFHFREEGSQYAGYVVELILQEDGNLSTQAVAAENW